MRFCANAKLPRRLCTNALVISRLCTNAKLPRRFCTNALVIRGVQNAKVHFGTPLITNAFVRKCEITKAFVHKRLGNQGFLKNRNIIKKFLHTKAVIHKRLASYTSLYNCEITSYFIFSLSVKNVFIRCKMGSFGWGYS